MFFWFRIPTILIIFCIFIIWGILNFPFWGGVTIWQIICLFIVICICWGIGYGCIWVIVIILNILGICLVDPSENGLVHFVGLIFAGFLFYLIITNF